MGAVQGRGAGVDENAALLPRPRVAAAGNDLSQALLPSEVGPDGLRLLPSNEEEKTRGNEEDEQKGTMARPTVPRLTQPRAKGEHRIGVTGVGVRRPPSLSVAALSSASPSLSPYGSCDPLDVWVSIFSFLSQADLARVSQVSHRWATTAYDPLLWTSIHLCHRYHRVDDALIAALLSSNRFPHLHHLCLDRCSAVTDVSLGYIQAFCPRLHHLSLVHCHRLSREGVLAYMAGSSVGKVELIGAMGQWEELVRGVAELGREVDLGFYFLEFCAKLGVRWKASRSSAGAGGSGGGEGPRERERGRDREGAGADSVDGAEDDEKGPTRLNGRVVGLVPMSPHRPSAAVEAVEAAFADADPASRPAAAANAVAAIAPSAAAAPAPALPLPQLTRATCRHSRSVADNPSASACWGGVTGRVVLSSAFYHVPGNYPVHVLYSCEQHSDTDLSDVRFHRCANCEQLFVPQSMYSDVVCNFCYDSENLSRRHNWITLNLQSIRRFGLSEVVGKTIRVAEKKNLPISLKSYKDSECRLDYTLPDDYHAGDEDDEGGADEEDGGERKGGDDGMDEGDGEVEAERKEAAGQRTGRGRRRTRRGGQSASAALSASSASSAFPPSTVPPTASTALLSSAPPLDATRVPLTTFLSHNAARLDRTVDSLQSHLREAYHRGCTRALLVLDEAENIEVLADSRVIADGLEGESHLKLVTLIWQRLLVLVYPLLLLFLLSSYYRELFNRLLYNVATVDGTILRTQYIVDPGMFGPLDLPILTAILGFFFLLLIALIVLFRRYRRYFELLFKKFLALDIFAIFSFGTLTVALSSAMALQLPLDVATLSVAVLNISMLCVYTLYFEVSTSLHTVSVMYLNAIMAVLLSGALDDWFAFWLPFGLCLIVAVLDLDLRPNLRLPPLLVPESMIIPSKPTILLCLNSVYVRPGELTLYGLMVTLVGPYNVVTVMGVMGLWVLLVLVVPFVSGERRWRKPLPFLLLLCSLLYWQYDKFIRPARYRWNGISWPAAT